MAWCLIHVYEMMIMTLWLTATSLPYGLLFIQHLFTCVLQLMLRLEFRLYFKGESNKPQELCGYETKDMPD